MTRFARAKGSKASNERRPEDPTPWHVMRQQLTDQLSNGDQKQKKDKDNISYNLKNYLNNSQDMKEVWSDISEFKDKSEEKKHQNEGREGLKEKKHRKKIIQSKCSEECNEFSGSTSEKGLVNLGNNTTEINPKVSKTERIRKNGNNYEVTVKSASDNCVKRKRIKPTHNKLNQENKKNNKSEEIVNVDGSDNSVKKKIKPTDNKLNQTNKKIRKSEEIVSVDSIYNSVNKKIMKPAHSKLNHRSKNPRKSEEIVNFDGSDNCVMKKIIKPTQKKLNQENKKTKKSEEIVCANETFTYIDKIKSNNDSSTQESSLSKKVKKSTVLENHKNVEEINRLQGKNKKTKRVFSSWKNENNCHTIIANGREIKVVSFEGFLIKKDDASELRKLRKKLKSQNIPKEKIQVIMKLERRRAEKALAREKTNVCFHCRKFGHKFSDCPEIKDTELSKSGICFKCGSTEHTHFQCKVLKSQGFRYAVCFVCKEQGHIARQCPLNPQGQYPKGGSCHLCGEVTHLKKDCPKAVETDSSKTDVFTVEKLNDNNLEDIGEINSKSKDPDIKKYRVIKF